MPITDEQIIAEVYRAFETKIEKLKNEFIVVSNNFTPQHDKVKKINEFIGHLVKPKP